MRRLRTALLAASLFAWASAASAALAPVGYYIGPDGLTRAMTGTASGTLTPSSTFTTPAGASGYTTGLLIANSGTNTAVVPLTFDICTTDGGGVMIRRAKVETTDTGFAGVAVTLVLHQTAPTYANGDHATWSVTDSGWTDDIPVTLDHAFSDVAASGVGTPAHGTEINARCAAGSTKIYGELKAAGSATPQGAKPWTVQLEAFPN